MENFEIMKKIIALFATLFFLTGCVSLHSALVSNVNEKDGKLITAEVSGMGILALTVPSTQSLEAAAVKKLKRKGVKSVISTRVQMRNFMVVQMYSVVATGVK